MFVSYDTVSRLIPEAMLVLVAAYLYLASTAKYGRSRAGWGLMAVAVYLIVGFNLRNQYFIWREGGANALLTGPIIVDHFGHALRWLAVGLGLVFTLVAATSCNRRLPGEYIGSLMLIVAGLMLVASANELVFLFVSLELVSIPTYVLLFLGRRDRASAEATAKYFFLSILSSALLLYGLTLLYGIGGTTLLNGSAGQPGLHEVLRQAAGAGRSAGLLPVALALVAAGLGFKLTVVPFHFYAPDVYQGTTNANAGLLAVAPKVAGLAALVRLLAVVSPALTPVVWKLLIVVAAITMTIGNISALWQSDLRRLMAYSSIAHAGYLLIGVAVSLATAGAPVNPAGNGIAATLFYLLVYALASAGTFAALAWLGSDEREVSGVEELAGLGREHPGIAAAISVFMFSLMGLPPLAGFWGKLTLFTGALSLSWPLDGEQSRWFIGLAVIGALNAAIGAAYYLRVIGVMYFRSSSASVPARGGLGPWLAATGCALLVVGVGVWPGPAVQVTNLAAGAVKRVSLRVTLVVPRNVTSE